MSKDTKKPRTARRWLHALVRRFRCLIGAHYWHGKGKNVEAHDGELITLVWWECPECGESKLKCILGNPRQSPNAQGSGTPEDK
ncbi:MAG: hypothetical protein AB7J34_26245, partial [Limisphaerales bacterium]